MATATKHLLTVPDTDDMPARIVGALDDVAAELWPRPEITREGALEIAAERIEEAVNRECESVNGFINRLQDLFSFDIVPNLQSAQQALDCATAQLEYAARCSATESRADTRRDEAYNAIVSAQDALDDIRSALATAYDFAKKAELSF